SAPRRGTDSLPAWQLSSRQPREPDPAPPPDSTGSGFPFPPPWEPGFRGDGCDGRWGQAPHAATPGCLPGKAPCTGQAISEIITGRRWQTLVPRAVRPQAGGRSSIREGNPVGFSCLWTPLQSTN
ncbi:hypothetical protein H1C71_018552, partial [Ictidomys tridecemlineatus]